MDIKFNNAVEARKIVDNVRDQLKTIPYSKDLYKYLRNIDALVTKISQEEVIARRNHYPITAGPTHQKVAESLDYLEKMILLAKLLQ